MPETLLLSIHGAAVLLFGVVLSFSFSNIRFTKKSIISLLVFYTLSGFLQLSLFLTFSEKTVWELYPLISHLPLILFLYSVYHKRLVTAVVSVFTSYLCCQPSEWVGILVFQLTNSGVAEYIARSIALPVIAFFILKFLASTFSEIFNNRSRSIWVFGVVPVVYYVFDYITTVYTDLWITDNRVVNEFLPFLLFIVFFLFCLVYHKEYEGKANAEQREHMVRIVAEEKSKELDAIRSNERKLNLLRHDLRLMLETLALSIENSDKETSLKIIKSYSSKVDATSLRKYCQNDILNYIFTNYADKCAEKAISISIEVDMPKIEIDEVSLSTIICNALDNAINAQAVLPEEKRQIKVMLKDADKKVLFSVKNTVGEPPVFINGMPSARKAGHGYGTQSILYMTEQLGGNCQFLLQNDMFVLRVII